MDPNKTLEELRELVSLAFGKSVISDDEYAMAELFEALDEWLSRGGFKPEAWQS